MWGLTEGDYAHEFTPVWPENWATVMFFADIPIGAWNVGPGGPTGIRPEAVREVRLARAMPLATWRAMYDDLQVMELAALDTIREQST